MRISAIAKKVKIKPSTIVTWCEENDIAIPNGANTKLEEDQIRALLQDLAPDELEDFFALPLPPTPTEEEDRLEKEFLINSVLGDEPEVEPIIEEKKGIETLVEISNELPDTEEIPNTENLPVEDNKQEDVEVIRAPKIQLQGLKVKGKIELPEPKEKQPKEEKKEPDQGERNRKKNFRKERKSFDPDYNPLAEERKRLAREAERQKQAEIKKQKEAKAQHYYKLHKEVAKVKKSKPEEELPQKQEEFIPEQKQGFISKLRKWFNS